MYKSGRDNYCGNGFSIETVTLIKDQACRRSPYAFDIQNRITFPVVLGVHRGSNRFVAKQVGSGSAL